MVTCIGKSKFPMKFAQCTKRSRRSIAGLSGPAVISTRPPRAGPLLEPLMIHSAPLQITIQFPSLLRSAMREDDTRVVIRSASDHHQTDQKTSSFTTSWRERRRQSHSACESAALSGPSSVSTCGSSQQPVLQWPATKTQRGATVCPISTPISLPTCRPMSV